MLNRRGTVLGRLVIAQPCMTCVGIGDESLMMVSHHDALLGSVVAAQPGRFFNAVDSESLRFSIAAISCLGD